MDAILNLNSIDLYTWFITGIAILLGAEAMWSPIEKLINRLGIETKWGRRKREEHELLIQTSQNLAALQEKHTQDMAELNNVNQELSNDIKKLTAMFVDKEINDMRWEINNFATKVSEGKPCNKDSFQHCIHTYEKYEELLKENGLENGEVEISIQIINEAYKQKMREGF